MKRLSLVALVLLALVPPTARAGGAATLGATLGGIPVYAEVSRTLYIESESARGQLVTADADGLGWAVEPAEFVLAAGGRQSLTITAVGADRGSLALRVRSERIEPGTQAGALVLVTALYPARPFDPALAVALALAAVALALAAVLWRRRRRGEP